jgi:hypothetical protein
LTSFDLAARTEQPQLGLGLVDDGRARRLEATLDRLAEKFGSRAIQRAANLGTD